jgi:hypothetical protein
VGSKPQFKDFQSTKNYLLADSAARIHIEQQKLKRSKSESQAQISAHLQIRDKSKETLQKICDEIEVESSRTRTAKEDSKRAFLEILTAVHQQIRDINSIKEPSL